MPEGFFYSKFIIRSFSSQFSFDGDNESSTWEKSFDMTPVVRLEPTSENPNEFEDSLLERLEEVYKIFFRLSQIVLTGCLRGWLDGIDDRRAEASS